MEQFNQFIERNELIDKLMVERRYI